MRRDISTARGIGRGLWMAAAFALALMLTGCGVTTTSLGGASPGGQGGTTTPVTAGRTPSGTATTSSAAHGGTPSAQPDPAGTQTAKAGAPCPGGMGSISGAGTPAVVLNQAGIDVSARAHVGDLVQVRLPASLRWSYAGSAPAGTLLQPAGYEDLAAKACVWNFRPVSAGTLSLRFSGSGICDAKTKCPQFQLAAFYTVVVSG